jgi:hypothetical protein
MVAGELGAFTTTTIVADAPLASVPIEQVTVAVPVHVP